MRLEDPDWTDVKKMRMANQLVPAEGLCQTIRQTWKLVGQC